MIEKAIEVKLRNGVKKLGGLALKFTSPSFAGVPDRIVLMPTGKVYGEIRLHGRIWFVELKAPGKKPTPLQLTVHALLRNMGFDVRVLDSAESVTAFLNEIA